MLLLGIDFETSGLKIGAVGVTEAGLVLWDTDLRAPVRLVGFLVDSPDAVWEPGVEKINGITRELCLKYGMEDGKALRQVAFMYEQSDAVVAHNGGEFDRPLLMWWAKKHGVSLSDKTWIDTKTDIEIPERNSTRLVYMAADHQFLNPFPHRALFDVMTMMKILDAHDLKSTLELAKSPNIRVKALVGPATKDLAKARGFHAQYENGTFQYWHMSVKACHLEQERAACKAAGFDIVVMSQ